MSSNNQSSYNNLVSLKIDDRLRKEGIVTDFFYDKLENAVNIGLNQNGKKMNVVFTIDGKKWEKNGETLTKILRQRGIDEEYISSLVINLDDTWRDIIRIRKDHNYNIGTSCLNRLSDLSTLNNTHKKKDLTLNQRENIDICKEIDLSGISTTISPSQALRKNSGTYKVKGTIISTSRLFRMISRIQFGCDICQQLRETKFHLPVFDTPTEFIPLCSQCNRIMDNKTRISPIFINSVIIELQDSETFNDLERLPVFLFDKDTEGIRIGETVTILGDTSILYSKKRYFTYFYAKSIHYHSRVDFTLSKLEIDAIKRFSQNKFDRKYHGSVIDQLIQMFDPSIVGHNNTKKGVLLSAVNTSYRIDDSEHIDILFIGPPGTGKSKILRRATELVPGSSNAGGQYSSGKSLTAIIDKVEDNLFLRLGLIPRSRGAFCAINEFGRQPLEDQDKLLDVMQERWFPFDKYGIHANIPAPTSILASANPLNTSHWLNNDKIDLNEFPFLEPLKDRFDLICTFHDKKTKEERSEFANKLSDIEAKKEQKQLPDYTYFLTRYIQYAKQIESVTLTDEARIMLTEYYKNIGNNGFGSPRILTTLFKLVKATARLKLKNIADEEDAKEIMVFYNFILVKFQKCIVVTKSPRNVAYEKGVSIVKRFKQSGGVTLEKLFELMCLENEQLSNYFGYGEKSLKIKNNKKVRNVYEMLLNHSSITKIKENPIVLKWQGDLSDLCDQDEKLNKIDFIEKTEEIDNKTNLEPRSRRSPESLDRDRKEEEERVDNGFGMKFSDKGPLYDLTEEQYDILTKNNENKEKEKDETI